MGLLKKRKKTVKPDVAGYKNLPVGTYLTGSNRIYIVSKTDIYLACSLEYIAWASTGSFVPKWRSLRDNHPAERRDAEVMKLARKMKPQTRIFGKCPSCGVMTILAPNSKTSRQCDWCGYPIVKNKIPQIYYEESNEVMRCSYCGELTVIGERGECINCGAPPTTKTFFTIFPVKVDKMGNGYRYGFQREWKYPYAPMNTEEMANDLRESFRRKDVKRLNSRAEVDKIVREWKIMYRVD